MQLLDAIRAELAKLTWRSGVLWVAIPLSILIPFAITAAISAGFETVSEVNENAGEGEIPISGFTMSQDNSVYWVLFFATFFMMCAAVNSYGSEIRNRTIDVFAYIQPSRWTLLTAKLVVYGVIGALTTFVATLAVNLILPHMFPLSWAEVDAFSPAGIRFLWAIPLYTVALTAFGLGLVALVRHTYLVVALVLFVKLGTEAMLLVVDVDLGDAIRRYSPFVNAEYSTGQLQGMPEDIWGMNPAIGYYVLVFAAVFALGLWRTSRIPRR